MCTAGEGGHRCSKSRVSTQTTQPKAPHLKRIIAARSSKSKIKRPAMQCSQMLKVGAPMSATPLFGAPERLHCCSSPTMCEDCYRDRGCSDDVEPILDTQFAEETITSAEHYVAFVKTWQQRGAEASFLVLHCNLLGQEAQILRQKFGLKRNTSIHIVYSNVRECGDHTSSPESSAVNLETSSSVWNETWKTEMTEKVKTVIDPTAVFQGSKLLNGMNTIDDITLDDLLIMYVPTIFAECYAHSLSALMNSLHTFTPFLDDGSSRRNGGCKVKAPPPSCCLENAVTHSQRTRRSLRDQALYDSANLVATQLYNGVCSHFGSHVCRELERRGAGIDPGMRIGLEDETVPFHNLYVARGGEVQLRRGMAQDGGGFEIVCWTCYGAPAGGEFVVPGLMYKFDTGQGSTVLFRPNRFYHATLPAENRDRVNEKFAVAVVS